MTEFQLNPKILTKICEILDGLESQDNEVLTQIYQAFETIRSQEPMFCFYLLHVIRSDEFSMKRRVYAMTILHQNFSKIAEEFMPLFIQISKPLLDEIIGLPFSPFTSLAASMLCKMVKLYGLEHFPDFFEKISVLFTQENTIQIGLECLKEMIFNSQQIPDPFLEIIIQLIGSPFTKQVFDICIGLCDQNIQFIHDAILPAIFTHYSSFDIQLLSQACNIAAKSYLESPDETTGDFLAQALSTKEFSICANILTEFNQKQFHIYPPLISSLLDLLENPDEDITSFGPCSMSQEVLLDLTQCYTDEMIEIANLYLHSNFPNVYQESLESTNVGHFLRCLYTILSYFTDTPEAQFYHSLIVSLLESPFRGDSCMCLMSLCFSNKSLLNDSFTRILQLLTDEDADVKYQALVSLSELVEFDNLEVSPEAFFFLIEFAKQTDDSYAWSLASRYLLHFDQLGSSEPNLFSFYQSLFQAFLEESIRPNYYLLDIFSTLILIIVEPFDTFDKKIFIFLFNQIVNEEFDENYFSSYLNILKSIFKVYSSDISNEIQKGNADMLAFIQGIQIRMISVLVEEEISNSLLLNDIYEVLFNSLNVIAEMQIQIPVETNQQYFESFFDLSLRKMTDISKKSKISEYKVQLLSFISRALCYFVTQMNPEFIQSFLEKCAELVSRFKPEEDIEANQEEITAPTIIETDENPKEENESTRIEFDENQKEISGQAMIETDDIQEEEKSPTLIDTLVSDLRNFANTMIALLEGNGIALPPEIKSFFS